MRLTEFSATNYLNHNGINIMVPPASRVLFITGANGSGKTGIAQGIRLALEGDPIRGLSAKNQLSALIKQGEDRGQVIVGATVEGVDGTWKTNLKSGAHEGGPLDGSPLSLDPAAFFALPAQERRKALFGMTGIRLNVETIKGQLIAKGHSAERIDLIAQFFRVGFDAAATKSREQATEARGAWKLITGETHGEVKGASWTAPLAKFDEVTKSVKTLEVDVAGAKAKADTARVALDAIKANAEQWKRAEKATKAKNALKANEKELTDLQSYHDIEKNALDEMRRCSQHSGGETAPCPACGVVLFWNAKGELQQWEKVKPTTPPVEAHRQIEAKVAEVGEIAAMIELVRQTVAEGKAAKDLIAQLPKQPTEEETRKAEGDNGTAQTNLAMLQSDLELARSAANSRAAAQEKTTLAAKYHADIAAFAALAEAIQNLPAEYLSSTLKAINELCAEAAAALDMPVVVGEDMEPRYGSIPYALASESQQWRIRMAVGYALAVMGKLGLVILDAFDMVEPKGRGAILKWLGAQTKVQVVLCATLKAKPELPAPFSVVWL